MGKRFAREWLWLMGSWCVGLVASLLFTWGTAPVGYSTIAEKVNELPAIGDEVPQEVLTGPLRDPSSANTTLSLAECIRAQYPGAYNDLTDAQLEVAAARKGTSAVYKIRDDKNGRTLTATCIAMPQSEQMIERMFGVRDKEYLSTDPNAGVPIIDGFTIVKSGPASPRPPDLDAQGRPSREIPPSVTYRYDWAAALLASPFAGLALYVSSGLARTTLAAVRTIRNP